MSKNNKAACSRRNFLAATGAAALGFPMLAKGQADPVTMRFQSAWPAKDIFHEYALDFAKTVNDMTGGELRIEVLPVNAVVPPAGLLDAVSKGALDGGHGALMDHSDRSNAFALWGSGPAFGMDSNMLLAWHKWGGGQELLEKLYAAIGGKVVSFLYAPLATPPLGWFNKPVTKWEDFKGLRYGTNGPSIDVFTAMGAEVKSLPGGEIVAAMADGRLDAAEACNTSSDRALGFAAASKVCMVQSYHRSAEQLEIMFNKARYDALPDRLRAVIGVAVDAASQNATWKAIDRNSRDFVALQEQDKVHVYKTPNSVLLKELECYDEMQAKKSGGNPLFKEILESQKKFAGRVVKWEQEVVVSRHLAYDHYFNHPVPAPKKSGRSGGAALSGGVLLQHHFPHALRQLRLHETRVIAVEHVPEQAAIQVAGAHHPIGNRKRQIHIALHHDSLVMVRSVVPAYGVDERAIAHKSILVHVAAVVKGFVNQVLADDGAHQDIAGVGVDQPTQTDRERRAQRHESEQRAPGKENNTEFARAVDRHLVVGEVLVMLARVPVVNRAKRPHVHQAVHHVLVDPPLENIRKKEHRHHQQPFPAGAVH